MLEPRFFPRATVDLTATVQIGGKKHQAKVFNLSEGGMMAQLTTVFPTKGFIVVQVAVPGRKRPISLRGITVRVDPAHDPSAWDIAVEWRNLGDTEAAGIRAIVEQHEKMAWGSGDNIVPREVAVEFVPIIRRVAWTLAHRLRFSPAVGIDDLLGAGFVALVEVYRKNPNVARADLARIATPRIRGAMLDELRGADPLSRRLRQRNRRLSQVREQLTTEFGREPTDQEVATRAQVKPRQYAEAMRATQASFATSLDDARVPDVADHSSDAEDQVSRGEDMDRIRMALGGLPPRLRRVLELHYGDDLTLREIGNLLGVTEARISQLLSAAVKKIRESCGVSIEQAPASRSARKSRSSQSPMAATGTDG